MAPSILQAETLVAGPDATVELLADHPSLAVSAARFAPGAAPEPPPHVHAAHTEAFLVIDGTLSLVLGSEERVAGAGTVVVVPPGVTHTFRADGEVRFLDIHTPSTGYGSFVRALSAAKNENELARARATFDQQAPPAGGSADASAVVVVCTRGADGPDGEAITDRPGRRVTLLADTEHLTLTDFDYGPGQRGASPHVHHDHSDAFLVVEGELEITFEDGPLRAPAGTFVLIPPGVIHSFDNSSDAAARFLNIHAPSCGFGDYLRGQNPGFDQHEPPASGGLDPGNAVIVAFGASA